MAIVFVILIVVTAAALGFFVLIQNPKGGGLAGNVGGLSNQFMGVKQTNDVLENGTWISAGIIGLLSLFSVLLLKGSGQKVDTDILNKVNTNQSATPAPQQQATPATPAPAQGK